MVHRLPGVVCACPQGGAACDPLPSWTPMHPPTPPVVSEAANKDDALPLFRGRGMRLCVWAGQAALLLHRFSAMAYCLQPTGRFFVGPGLLLHASPRGAATRGLRVQRLCVCSTVRGSTGGCCRAACSRLPACPPWELAPFAVGVDKAVFSPCGFETRTTAAYGMVEGRLCF